MKFTVWCHIVVQATLIFFASITQLSASAADTYFEKINGLPYSSGDNGTGIDGNLQLLQCVNSQRTDLVVIVQSRRNNFEQRQVIRRSWGNKSFFPSVNVCIFFVVASDAAVHIQYPEKGFDSDFQQHSYFSGKKSSHHRACGSRSDFEERALCCLSSTTQQNCTDRICNSYAKQFKHCLLYYEYIKYHDVVLLPMIESASHEQSFFSFVNWIQTLQRHYKVDMNTQSSGPQYLSPFPPDILFVTDSTVVNLQHIFEHSLVPSLTGKLLRQYPTPTVIAEQTQLPVAAIDAEFFDNFLVSSACPREISLAISEPGYGFDKMSKIKSILQEQIDFVWSNFHNSTARYTDQLKKRVSQRCTIISFYGPKLLVPCSSDTPLYQLQRSRNKISPLKIMECWRDIRRESDMSHQRRPLLPKFTSVIMGSRRRAFVTVIVSVPDVMSSLVSQIIDQVRHQTLQPHVNLVLVISNTENMEAISEFLEKEGYSEWITIFAVDKTLSLGMRRNTAIREFAERSRYLTIWDLKDYHMQGLLQRQVSELQHFASSTENANTAASYLTCAPPTENLGHISYWEHLHIVVPIFAADLNRYCEYRDADVGIDSLHMMCAAEGGFYLITTSCANDVVHPSPSISYKNAFLSVSQLGKAVLRDYHIALSEYNLLYVSKNAFQTHALQPRIPVRITRSGELWSPQLDQSALNYPLVSRLANFQRRPPVSLVVMWSQTTVLFTSEACDKRIKMLLDILRKDVWHRQIELILCGAGSEKDHARRVRLLAEWKCEFCQYTHHITNTSSNSTAATKTKGHILQRGINFSRSKYIVLLHIEPFEWLLSDNYTDIAALMRAWHFSVENLLTPVFTGEAEAVLWSAVVPGTPATESLSYLLASGQAVIGFVHNIRTHCSLASTDADYLHFFMACIQSSGFKVFTQKKQEVKRAFSAFATRKYLEMIVREDLPDCVHHILFGQRFKSIDCLDTLIASQVLHKSRRFSCLLTFVSEGDTLASLPLFKFNHISTLNIFEQILVVNDTNALCGTNSQSVAHKVLCLPWNQQVRSEARNSLLRNALIAISHSGRNGHLIPHLPEVFVYTDDFISKVEQHFFQENADLLLCRCWEIADNKYSPVQLKLSISQRAFCAITIAELQIVAISRKVVLTCMTSQSDWEHNPHNFFACVLSNGFKVVERQSCSPFFTKMQNKRDRKEKKIENDSCVTQIDLLDLDSPEKNSNIDLSSFLRNKLRIQIWSKNYLLSWPRACQEHEIAQSRTNLVAVNAKMYTQISETSQNGNLLIALFQMLENIEANTALFNNPQDDIFFDKVNSLVSPMQLASWHFDENTYI